MGFMAGRGSMLGWARGRHGSEPSAAFQRCFASPEPLGGSARDVSRVA